MGQGGQQTQFGMENQGQIPPSYFGPQNPNGSQSQGNQDFFGGFVQPYSNGVGNQTNTGLTPQNWSAPDQSLINSYGYFPSGSTGTTGQTQATGLPNVANLLNPNNQVGSTPGVTNSNLQAFIQAISGGNGSAGGAVSANSGGNSPTAPGTGDFGNPGQTFGQGLGQVAGLASNMGSMGVIQALMAAANSIFGPGVNNTPGMGGNPGGGEVAGVGSPTATTTPGTTSETAAEAGMGGGGSSSGSSSSGGSDAPGGASPGSPGTSAAF